MTNRVKVRPRQRSKYDENSNCRNSESESFKIKKQVRLSVNSYNEPGSKIRIVPFDKDDNSKDSMFLTSKKDEKSVFIRRRSSLQISNGDIVDSNKSKMLKNGESN